MNEKWAIPWNWGRNITGNTNDGNDCMQSSNIVSFHSNIPSYAEVIRRDVRELLRTIILLLRKQKSMQQNVKPLTAQYLAHSPHHPDDVLRHPGIEARGRLVAEEEGRVGQNLGGEGQPPHLATRDTLDPTSNSDEHVLAFCQAKLRKNSMFPSRDYQLVNRESGRGTRTLFMTCSTRSSLSLSLMSPLILKCDWKEN